MLFLKKVWTKMCIVYYYDTFIIAVKTAKLDRKKWCIKYTKC